jgi:hypothetical protein
MRVVQVYLVKVRGGGRWGALGDASRQPDKRAPSTVNHMRLQPTPTRNAVGSTQSPFPSMLGPARSQEAGTGSTTPACHFGVQAEMKSGAPPGLIAGLSARPGRARAPPPPPLQPPVPHTRSSGPPPYSSPRVPCHASNPLPAPEHTWAYRANKVSTTSCWPMRASEVVCVCGQLHPCQSPPPPSAPCAHAGLSLISWW